MLLSWLLLLPLLLLCVSKSFALFAIVFDVFVAARVLTACATAGCTCSSSERVGFVWLDASLSREEQVPLLVDPYLPTGRLRLARGPHS